MVQDANAHAWQWRAKEMLEVERRRRDRPRHVAQLWRGKGRKAGSLTRKHDHYTPTRKMRRDVRALTARNHPEGRFYPMERHAL